MDITTLFPHYSLDQTPRWGRLFKLPYPPRLYEQFRHQPVVDEETGEDLEATASNLHLVFRNYLDLGQLPDRSEQFAQAEREDEVRKLEEGEEPETINGNAAAGQTFLAGAERSWWQVAFAAKLAEVEAELSNPLSKNKTTGADCGAGGKGGKKFKKNKDESSKGTSNETVSVATSNCVGDGSENLSKFK